MKKSTRALHRLQVGLYRHCLPPQEPARAKLTAYLKPPSQVPGTVVSSNFQVPKSAGTVVGEGFGFRRTLNQTNLLIYINLYIFQLEISTPQVRSKISTPTHNIKPTTISASNLQATSFLLPPRSDLQVVISASIVWQLIGLRR